ncbi:MAG: hypothetical protein WD989_01860 [Candidatus Paceibacterota bacterium]
MAKESLEYPGSVEGTVKFEKETCCALERGFEHNPGVVQELKKALGSQEVNMMVDILPNTEEMKFVPSENMKTVYGQIAKRELERIQAEDEDDEDLSCGHSVEDHIQALERVMEKMEPEVIH